MPLMIQTRNSLFRDCLDQHAPLQRTKISRPPAPWMKIVTLPNFSQKDCQVLRVMSTINNIDEHSRSRYRNARNELKRKIKTAKRDSTSERFHLKKQRMPGKSYVLYIQYFTQTLNPCELILMSLIFTSHLQMNVSLEQCLSQPKNCGLSSTLYRVILLALFVFVKLIESLSSTSNTNTDTDVFTSVLILVPGILKR